MRYNPFEERRKNERINRLVKENAELTVKIDQLKQDYESKRLYADLMDLAVEVNQSKMQELIKENKELFEAVWYLYNFSKGMHFHEGSITDKEIKELLTKCNHFKSSTDE